MALTPLAASAALLQFTPAPGAPADGIVVVQAPPSSVVDILNDPQPFRMKPEGFETPSFDGVNLQGAELLFVADRRGGDNREAQKAAMMKKVEAKIQELRKAGKNDQANAMAKRLAEIKKAD